MSEATLVAELAGLEGMEAAELRLVFSARFGLSARISALATKLRLTPQSRYGTRAAATAAG